MAAVVKCEPRELRSDSVLVVDRARIAANCAAEEGAEVFVFWHDRGAEKARLAMQGRLLSFTPLERLPRHHSEALIHIQVTQRSPNENLLVMNLNKDSHIAAERTLYDKVGKVRWERIASLDDQETDYLRDRSATCSPPTIWKPRKHTEWTERQRFSAAMLVSSHVARRGMAIGVKCASSALKYKADT